MKSNSLRWLGVILILETGLLHIMTAQAEYDEAAYMGYLFAANFFGALVAALGIYHRQAWGWMLGCVIAAGSIVGYVWSRTLGMPGMSVEEWFSAYGVASLAVEGAFLLLAFFRPWKMRLDSAAVAGSAARYGMPVATLTVVALTGFLTYQWNAAMVSGYGHHVGSLSQVCSTPATTFAELEQEHGVMISLAATSMMGSIVDVRIKIVDPDKAHAFLQNQAALLVNQEVLILAPHMHSHVGSRLKAGKIFTIFFPAQHIVKPGSEVSLVLGPVRVEPVIVK